MITDCLGLDAACTDNPELPIRSLRADAAEVGGGLGEIVSDVAGALWPKTSEKLPTLIT